MILWFLKTCFFSSCIFLITSIWLDEILVSKLRTTEHAHMHACWKAKWNYFAVNKFSLVFWDILLFFLSAYHVGIFFFFLMRTIYNAFVELVAILLLLSVLIFWLQGMLDLCSPTRDWTLIPFIGRSSLNHWTTREVPFYFFLTQRSCWIINFERGEYPQGSWKTTSGSSVNTKLPATGDTVWWECTTRSLYSSQNGIGG